MVKKKSTLKAVVETISEFVVTGPDSTTGWVKVYRDYPVDAPVPNNLQNSGGEIWDWAQSHWPEFTEEEQDIEVGGGIIRGLLRWICVRGVKDEKGSFLPIKEAESYRRYKSSSSSSERKKSGEAKAKGKDKSGSRAAGSSKKKASGGRDEFGGIFDGVDVGAEVGKRIQRVLEEG
jgi:hypothetical protein